MAKNYFDYIDDAIENMSEHDQLLLAKKIIDKVSYYNETHFTKMLRIMNLYYRDVLGLESGNFDAFFEEKVQQALDEQFDIEIPEIDPTKNDTEK